MRFREVDDIRLSYGQPTENVIKTFPLSLSVIWIIVSFCTVLYPVIHSPDINICEAYQLNVSCGEQPGIKEEWHADLVACLVFAL